MPTFPSRLGRVPVLLATAVVALVLFGLLLLGGRSSAPPSAVQPGPSTAPITAAPSAEVRSAAQPVAQTAVSAARSEPTNTLPPATGSAVPSEPAAVAAASGTSADSASSDQAAETPQAETPAATDSARTRPGGTTAAPAPPDQADPAQRYVDVAQRAAPPRQGQRPGSDWQARVIDDNQGYAVMLIVPLDAGANNTEFVRVAKERIAAIVNAMFLNDPQIIRVGVIGTFPNQGGSEVPAVSIIVNKAASPRWGQVSPAELERIAQSLTVEQQFQR